MVICVAAAKLTGLAQSGTELEAQRHHWSSDLA